MLAELAVGGPVLAVSVAAERQGVDQQGPGALELDVVGGGVDEGNPLGKESSRDVEVGEGCGLQGRKRPFVGIRPEWQPGVFENDAGLRRGVLRSAVLSSRALMSSPSATSGCSAPLSATNL